MILGVLFLGLYVTLHLFKLLGNIHDANEWAASTEVIMLSCGAFFVAGFRIIRHIFALGLIVFGVQHFMYDQFISYLIPDWIPSRVFFAQFVGIIFFATAISIIMNWMTWLSTFLLGIMFLSWVFILHAPRVNARPAYEAGWTSLFIALAMSGASFCLSWISIKHDEWVRRTGSN